MTGNYVNLIMCSIVLGVLFWKQIAIEKCHQVTLWVLKATLYLVVQYINVHIGGTLSHIFRNLDDSKSRTYDDRQQSICKHVFNCLNVDHFVCITQIVNLLVLNIELCKSSYKRDLESSRFWLLSERVSSLWCCLKCSAPCLICPCFNFKSLDIIRSYKSPLTFNESNRAYYN